MTTKQTNLFTSAKKKSKKALKKDQPKGTRLKMPNHLNMVVHDFINYTKIKKSSEVKLKELVDIIKPVARQLFTNRWINQAKKPAGPVVLENDQNEEINYVVTNKANQNSLSQEQISTLQELLGPKITNKIIHQVTGYTLNPEILSQPGVIDKLSRAIYNAGLTDEQAKNLLVGHTKVFLKPDAISNLLEYTGVDQERLMCTIQTINNVFVDYPQVPPKTFIKE